MQRAPVPVSLYVHVPFCVSKCAYCDFASSVVDVNAAAVGGASDLGDAFVDAVLARVAAAAEKGLLRHVPSVYVGGGTPTVLGVRLVRMVSALRALPGLPPGAEFTIETNPETTDAALVSALVAAGVTRFSVGVQSFDDAVLATLGRCHDARRATAAAETLRTSGAEFSVDLMCGVPGQTMRSWQDSVASAVATGAGHVSVYPLSIEDGTPFGRAVDAGEMAEPDSDESARMMQVAAEMLADAGFTRYEVASYARPGRESCHNTVYWTGGEYLGVGPSAASMLPGADARKLAGHGGWAADCADDARVRFVMDPGFEEFLGGTWRQAPSVLEVLNAEDAVREDAMLGMRMSAGIATSLAEDAGIVGILEQLQDRGLVHHVAGRWRPTQSGWLLGNEVFSAIWNRE